MNYSIPLLSRLFIHMSNPYCFSCAGSELFTWSAKVHSHL